jgi:hypothetical protein
MTKPIPETSPEYGKAHITERPDGFYWQDQESKDWFGPFPTLLDAEQDMEYNPESDYEPGETLQEAEAEIGIADWIDPITGEPAEESHHHIEDN